MSPHPHLTTAELVLEAPIDPLDSRALVVASLVGKHVARRAPRLGFAPYRLFAFERAAGIDGDDGRVAQVPAVGPYLVSVLSGVHEVIQIACALSRQARQCNGRLRVMQRRRRQETTHRHPAIGRVDM